MHADGPIQRKENAPGLSINNPGITFHYANNMSVKIPSTIETTSSQFKKYGLDVHIEACELEGFFLLASWRPELAIEEIASKFALKTRWNDFARIVLSRNARLKGQPLLSLRHH